MLVQDVIVMDQPSGPMDAYQGGGALHKEALHSPQQMDNQLGELTKPLQGRSDTQRYM